MKQSNRQKFDKLASLSVFLPCFNEAGNIRKQVEDVLAVVPDVAKKYEVIVVDDGSEDKTASIAKQLAKKYAEVRLVSQENKGYGGAVKRGFEESGYEWVFFTDADLQFDVSELKLLVEKAEGQDMVLGYRLNRADGRKRQLLAKGLKVWNRVWLGFPSDIRDIDCAFKLIKRQVVTDVSPLLSDGAMVSTEFLLRAKRSGAEYAQVGVQHFDRQVGDATGSDLGVIWRAVVDTFRLRKVLFKQTSLGKTLVSGKRSVKYGVVVLFLFWMKVGR